MDERKAERLLYVDATLVEMDELAARGRETYDSDIAVARACQYNIIRLASDLERFGEGWIEAHPEVPFRLIKAMRNRVAHNYSTIDDDLVWEVITVYGPALRNALGEEIDSAHALLDAGDR